MNIKPAFYNDAGETKYAVTVGKPSDMNGSILSGSHPYTYTSIRFQLSRDSSNNIYVKIYKINRSLNMPRCSMKFSPVMTRQYRGLDGQENTGRQLFPARSRQRSDCYIRCGFEQYNLLQNSGKIGCAH